MEPFNRVCDQRTLTCSLDETFEIYRWLNEKAIGKSESSNIPSSQNVACSSGASLSSSANLTNKHAMMQDRVILEEEEGSHLGKPSDPSEVAIELRPHELLFSSISQEEKENSDMSHRIMKEEHSRATTITSASTPGLTWLGFADNSVFMSKRQLIDALTSTFLGDLKTELIERVHEFTDCAYTKHEHRETILQLVQCIKLQLNKLVKLTYRMVSQPTGLSCEWQR